MHRLKNWHRYTSANTSIGLSTIVRRMWNSWYENVMFFFIFFPFGQCRCPNFARLIPCDYTKSHPRMQNNFNTTGWNWQPKGYYYCMWLPAELLVGGYMNCDMLLQFFRSVRQINNILLLPLELVKVNWISCNSMLQFFFRTEEELNLRNRGRIDKFEFETSNFLYLSFT